MQDHIFTCKMAPVSSMTLGVVCLAAVLLTGDALYFHIKVRFFFLQKPSQNPLGAEKDLFSRRVQIYGYAHSPLPARAPGLCVCLFVCCAWGANIGFLPRLHCPFNSRGVQSSHAVA